MRSSWKSSTEAGADAGSPEATSGTSSTARSTGSDERTRVSSGSLGSGWLPDGQHRTRRLAHGALGHAAEQHVLEPGVAVGTHHDQVGAPLARLLGDLLGGDSLPHLAVDPDPIAGDR